MQPKEWVNLFESSDLSQLWFYEININLAVKEILEMKVWINKFIHER